MVRKAKMTTLKSMSPSQLKRRIKGLIKKMERHNKNWNFPKTKKIKRDSRKLFLRAKNEIAKTKKVLKSKLK